MWAVNTYMLTDVVEVYSFCLGVFKTELKREIMSTFLLKSVVSF